jgi:mono/diheme cytochrome c family protein
LLHLSESRNVAWRSQAVTVAALLFVSPELLQAAAASDSELAIKARNVLKANCHRCHHGKGSDGGEFDLLRVETLTARLPDGDGAPVVPGKPADSLLIKKYEAGEMPPEDSPVRPSKADMDLVRAWIAAGAPAFPGRVVDPPVPLAEALTAIRDDLRRAAGEDRPFQRYFTLTHLYNNPQIAEEELRLVRAALSKAINSLSWKPRIVVPRAIDKQATVLAVDLRDLDWHRDNLWRTLVGKYPYGRRPRGDHPLAALDDEIEQLAAFPLVMVNADWFIAAATRPPLYHAMLRLPDNARDLERQLQVDVLDDFRRDRLARAGFFPSGVSGQNRLVERHEALYGAYWKSYDFKKGTQRQDLKRLPLGPDFSGSTFKHQAFVHDGGEIIFDLPNHLQGYMLVKGDDTRIDAGPIEVVSDALKTSGTNEIVNGLSCLACHQQGMKDFTDQIRTGAAVTGDAARKVKRLYPEQKLMNELLAADRVRYLAALKQAIGPFLGDGQDDGAASPTSEPIGFVARLYALTPLSLAAVTAELGLDGPAELQAKLGENGLRELGLLPLVNGDSLSRHDWETGPGMSLMQRVSRELGYTPFDIGLGD